MERDEEKVVIGRKGNDSAREGWWMQHLWLTHAGERLCLEHVGGGGGGVLSHRLPPECCRTVLHYAWATCESDPHTE